MTVPDIIRDSFVGQIVYYASGRRLFQYPEEKPGFDFVEQYTTAVNTPSTPRSRSPTPKGVSSRRNSVSDKELSDSDKKSQSSVTVAVIPNNDEAKHSVGQEESTVGQEYLHPDVEKGALPSDVVGDAFNPNIVTWYGSDDPELPTNVRIHNHSAMDHV